MRSRRLLGIGGAVAAATALVVCGLLVAMAGAASTPPAFVQQTSVHSSNVTSVKLTPAANVTSGNRLVVLVGVWSEVGAAASSVTDAAGNTYTEVLHFKASDNTEESVWTAPITAGGGTKPAITVKPSAKADVGAAVSEYSGLSTAAGAAAVDRTSSASGTTTTAGTVASGATVATTAGNELAVGAYVDSGFGDTLTVGSGYTQRSNVSKASNIDLLTEDQVLASSGATPNATAGNGAKTVWLMGTVVFAGGGPAAPPSVPGTPTGVSATAGDASASVTWTAPGDGGSPITSYTVTPYVGSTAQTQTTVNGPNPPTHATVSGLTNGTTYTFTVSATNAVGTGPESSPSAAVTPAAASGGSWGPVLNWPMTAIHSILLSNGKLLQFDGWQQPEPTQVWDPKSNTFTTQTAPDSIFCSGMAELPDGRVLVIGGWGGLSTGLIGINDTAIFDPATETWSRVADMHSPRWYPDLTELSDGRFVAISGNTTDAGNWADTPEVYDPTANKWTALTGVSTSGVHEEEYPFSYLIPNGNVFTIGPAEDQSFELNADAKTWTPVGGSSGVVNGSSVMYRPGQVLYSGGAANLNSSTPAKANAAVIDLNSATPTWQQTAPMAHARIYHTLTMLADGTVLAVGGEPTAGQTGKSEVSGGVLPSEIWDPNSKSWSPAADTGATRGYHSTAVLMPDATVLVGGSGAASPGYAAQQSAQIYSPPYLSKGPRPTIGSSPASATYGSNFAVSTPDAASISAVNLVSLGSDTHQSDMDQHFVPLSFTKGDGSLSIQAPASGSYAPPGNYMLFLVNSNGVPSVASFIHMRTSITAPGAPRNVSATANSGGAQLTWTAPDDGGSPITGYTVTPYIGSAAQTPTAVSGPNPPTKATISGLTNGTSYTFTVTATNSIGTSSESAPSAAVTPAASPTPTFVQQVSAHAANVTTLAVTPGSAVVAGDRLVVAAGVWNSNSPSAQSVTDSAGDTFTELLHFRASDHTEMSVWSAPITSGAGTTPKITVTASAKADVGVGALEYSGPSTVADATVVDQTATASGATATKGATVSSGATPAVGAVNELALGFYTDSGFDDALAAGAGFTQRINVSSVGDIELLAEDRVVGTGDTPAATVATGPKTSWLMATVVLKPAGGAQAMSQLSGGQSGVAGGALAETAAATAIARGGSTAPSAMVKASAAAVATGAGDPLSSATASSVPKTSIVPAARATPSRARAHRARTHHSRHAGTVSACAQKSGAKARRSCVSEHRAAAITKRAKRRFVYLALLKNLTPGLFCHHGFGALKNVENLSSGWFAWS